MRSEIVPAALLCLALGLALASVPRRVRTPCLFALVATLLVFSQWRTPRGWLEVAFLGCWLAVIATAASVHLGARIGLLAALVLSVDAGIWASALLSLSSSRFDLLHAAPWALVAVPASWVVRRHGSVPVKVLSSWVIAVAVLAISLQLLPVTPGYLPDHLE